MNAIDKLNRILNKQKQIKRLYRDLKQARASAETVKAHRYDTIAGGYNTESATERAIFRITEMEEQITREKRAYKALCVSLLPDLETLSDRERFVIVHIMLGMKKKTIAQIMEIDPYSVGRYKRRALEKLSGENLQ